MKADCVPHVAGAMIYLMGIGSLCTMAQIEEGHRITPALAMGFEVEGAWHTAPVELLGTMSEDELWCSKKRIGTNWLVKPIRFSDLAGGMTLSSAHVRTGKHSGLWKDHERFPTLVCTTVEKDWSAFRTFEISIYSEVETNETISLAIRSDSDRTPWKDFFLHSFTVDWQGWKTLQIPLKAFEAYEEPAGWQQVDGIYFFAKAFGHQPNPYTALFLDTIRLLTDLPPQPPADPPPPDTFVYQIHHQDHPLPLNHPFPETSHPSAGATRAQAISHQHYFRAERALFKYYPRFNPGYPSFAPDGRAYINAGETIQWLDEQEQWVISDIKSVLIEWAREQGWEGLHNGWGWQGADPMVRFDLDGDAYVLQQVEQLDDQGKPVSWKTRSALLLHSRDGLRTWSVHRLPGRTAGFEKVDGYNQDCLLRPPVILLGDYKYFGDADPAGYLLVPEKRPDGSLHLPEPVQYAANCLDVNYHSGDGNLAVTHGDKVYIVWGWSPPEKQRTGGYRTTLPQLPVETHAGFRQQFKIKTHWEWTAYSKDGVPAFVVTYDLRTREMSKPVYVGSGGGEPDGHNWPAITIDSQGYLHVIINGHHNPTNYTRSLRPYDISAWTPPEYILVNTDLPNLTYATLTCGRDGTLYSVHRSTKGIYNNHLGLYRKRAGAEWEEERTLVAPFKDMYKVWYHKMSYDAARDRLFLTYYSQAGLTWLSRDMYEFYIFFWPDREKLMNASRGQGPQANNPGPVQPGAHYLPGAGEITTLVSDDDGETWRLALTADFAQRGG